MQDVATIATAQQVDAVAAQDPVVAGTGIDDVARGERGEHVVPRSPLGEIDDEDVGRAVRVAGDEVRGEAPERQLGPAGREDRLETLFVHLVAGARRWTRGAASRH